MKRISLRSAAAFLILISVESAFSQDNRVGGSVLYNLGNKGLGFDIRAEFPVRQIDLLEGISIVPQITYYPSFNTIHEFYIGSGVHLNVYNYDRWTFYGLMNLSYNGWINNENTEYRSGNFSNLGFDVGVGMDAKLFKCLYPFFEFHYDFKWNDPVIQLGIMYMLQCDRRGSLPCPKVPPPPF